MVPSLSEASRDVGSHCPNAAWHALIRNNPRVKERRGVIAVRPSRERREAGIPPGPARRIAGTHRAVFALVVATVGKSIRRTPASCGRRTNAHPKARCLEACYDSWVTDVVPARRLHTLVEGAGGLRLQRCIPIYDTLEVAVSLKRGVHDKTARLAHRVGEQLAELRHLEIGGVDQLLPREVAGDQAGLAFLGRLLPPAISAPLSASQ